MAKEQDPPLYSLMMKLIDLKVKTLMSLQEDELIQYLKTGLPRDCFKEYSMPDLLDFNAMCENLNE